VLKLQDSTAASLVGAMEPLTQKLAIQQQQLARLVRESAASKIRLQAVREPLPVPASIVPPDVRTARWSAETAKAVGELVDIAERQEDRLNTMAAGQAELVGAMQTLVEAQAVMAEAQRAADQRAGSQFWWMFWVTVVSALAAIAAVVTTMALAS
jgi:hypothetical protein